MAQTFYQNDRNNRCARQNCVVQGLKMHTCGQVNFAFRGLAPSTVIAHYVFGTLSTFAIGRCQVADAEPEIAGLAVGKIVLQGKTHRAERQ
jgi:hypothetical protein